MNFPERPHLAPCACDECATWARTIVATPSERKPPRQSTLTEKPDMPMAEFMRYVIATACKATGLTEEQLRAKAAEIGSDIPETKPDRYTREAVAARGVPEKHLIAVYDKVPQKCPAHDAVTALLGSHKTILVLSGGVGTRKSGSACHALTVKPGRYIKASRLPALASSSTDEDRAVYSYLFKCQVLVIDDLGGEYEDAKAYFTKLFGELIDERYERQLKTIITTNIDYARFKTAYGERVGDRLAEAGRWVNIGGSSVRKLGAV